jgi:hypothetical protein
MHFSRYVRVWQILPMGNGRNSPVVATRLAGVKGRFSPATGVLNAFPSEYGVVEKAYNITAQYTRSCPMIVSEQETADGQIPFLFRL